MANITELFGTLTALNGSGTVYVTTMELEHTSAMKLLNVVTTQRVDRENQNLFIQQIYVKKEHAALFQSGQGSGIRNENGYILEAAPGNPVRFRADLQTAIECNNLVYAADIKLGNIAFDLSNATVEEDGEDVLFENVSATLYPGTYRKSIKGL